MFRNLILPNLSNIVLSCRFRSGRATVMPLKIAVVGAGAAGLCAMRHLLSKPDVFDGVCFEQGSQVGGTWIYTDRIGTDEKGLPVHSSMYQNLKTNLPKEVMSFPDFPFKKTLPSFIRHEDVLHYLEDYCSHFNIAEKIKFQTKVDSIHPVTQDEVTKWKVTYSSILQQGNKNTDMFDGVIVCNGHYSTPLMPDFPGLGKFKGDVYHSHDYRRPDKFKGQRVAILGAQSSGLDIMVELSAFADKVYVCHNKSPLTTALPSNVEERPGIVGFTEDSAIFPDNKHDNIDSVIFCTGYKYTFPFLSEQCHLKIEDERVTPLYKHLIHTEYPSMSFIGVCKVIAPFPQFHLQVLVALSALQGTLKLPSREGMDMDTDLDFQSRLAKGMPKRYAHHMGDQQWAYNDELADLAKCPRIEKRVEDMYKLVHNWRHENIAVYKGRNLELVEPDSFREVE